jgi:biopolymer transport protein ExbB
MLTDKFFVIAQLGHEITLWLLLALSVLSIAFILERFFTLRAVRSNSIKVSNRLRECLQSSSFKDIEDLSRDRESVEGRALAYGLRHIRESGPAGVEEIFNTYASLEKPILEKYLTFLATVGSNAPFIGLLGTVFGIMDAFRSLANSQGDASVVMVGISKALIATATGLLVAIPAVIAYNYFQKQVRSIMQSLDGIRDFCVAFAKSPAAANWGKGRN